MAKTNNDQLKSHHSHKIARKIHYICEHHRNKSIPSSAQTVLLTSKSLLLRGPHMGRGISITWGGEAWRALQTPRRGPRWTRSTGAAATVAPPAAQIGGSRDGGRRGGRGRPPAVARGRRQRPWRGQPEISRLCDGEMRRRRRESRVTWVGSKRKSGGERGMRGRGLRY
jgi:hypothetical protein